MSAPVSCRKSEALLPASLVDALLEEQRTHLDELYRERYGELVGNRCWSIYRSLREACAGLPFEQGARAWGQR